jgi:methylated-DNA-[protein]-cysteine S-methyltransferase
LAGKLLLILDSAMYTVVFETALGWTALARSDETVQALSFGHAKERSATRALANTLSAALEVAGSQVAEPCFSISNADVLQPGEDALVDRLIAFAEGESTTFDDLDVADGHLSGFGRKVIAACRKIAWGQTLTYGQLARRAGRPRAARAVGSVMARNRVPLIVPCHRVVAASGGLGGFSAPQGISMKERLLDMERQIPAFVAQEP